MLGSFFVSKVQAANCDGYAEGCTKAVTSGANGGVISEYDYICQGGSWIDDRQDAGPGPGCFTNTSYFCAGVETSTCIACTPCDAANTCIGSTCSDDCGTHAGTKVCAGVSTGNARGWLWGWSVDNLGKFAGMGWVSMNSLNETTTTASYGVSIPESGILSGYAWSAYYGYIDFGNNCTTGVPVVGQYKALSCTPPSGSAGVTRSGDNLTGWARIVGIANQTANNTYYANGNSGGYEGWISLSGTVNDASSTPYGVSINTSTNTLAGYAYSNEVGWINFDKASIEVPKTIEASISANPSIVANNTTQVTITANVTGGTAAGNNIKYELDCTNDGIIEDSYVSITGELNHIFTEKCTYSESKDVAVKISRDGVVATKTLPIIFGCSGTYCDVTNNIYSCKNEIKVSGCTNTCNATNCKKPVDANWIEVAP